VQFHTREVESQRAALKAISDLIEKGSLSPLVRQVAQLLTADCEARDDECELEAIFNAVKNGDDRVPALARGIRYVADPRGADYYTGAEAMLTLCARGACQGDCDDQTIMIASLAASLGFKAGARAWGPKRGTEYTHVYAIAAVPKRGPWPKGYTGMGMDASVPNSYLGWEPPPARVLTMWIT
jgi:transglutaminase-like putative cysteine protease